MGQASVGGHPAWCATPGAALAPRADGGRWQALARCGSLAAVRAIVRRAGVQPPGALRESRQGTPPPMSAAPPQQHQGDGPQDQRQEPGSRVWHVPHPSRHIAPPRLHEGRDQARGTITCVQGEHRAASLCRFHERRGHLRAPSRSHWATDIWQTLLTVDIHRCDNYTEVEGITLLAREPWTYFGWRSCRRRRSGSAWWRDCAAPS